MLYDPCDLDDAADLLIGLPVSGPSVADADNPGALPSRPGDLDLIYGLELRSGLDLFGEAGLTKDTDLLGALRSAAAREYVFGNGYGARVTRSGEMFAVQLLGTWLSGEDKREVSGLSASQVSEFLHHVEALPARHLAELSAS